MLPFRFATWCCMQRGKREPTPTMAPTPHGLPPSSQVRCAVANAWYRRVWVSWSKSATVAISP